MIEKIWYDVDWRIAWNEFLRSCIALFIIGMCTFVAFMVWEDERPYSGEVNDLVYVHGVAWKEQIDTLESEMKKLPKWVIEEYTAQGGTIHITDQPLENISGKEMTDYRTIGLFCVKGEEIRIWLTNSTCDIENAAIHEFGHFIDRYLDRQSETEEFLKCYDSEKDSFYGMEGKKYSIKDSGEYFAQSFMWYFSNPRTLKNNCPDTYNFIRTLMKGR